MEGPKISDSVVNVEDKSHLKEFERFLVSIDLKSYRQKYLAIRIVEMNLPKDIQAINLLYKVYWDEKEFLSFEKFYERYLKEYTANIQTFQKKTGMCEECFNKGLTARIYRTWASIVTQIHSGYVAESVFGPESVKMSEELDHHGADIQVNYRGVLLNFDVKKESRSGVVGRSIAPRKPIPGIFIQLRYTVPNFNTILHPEKKNGTGFLKAYLDFRRSFLDAGLLRVLPNGFVVFTPHVFDEKKKEIDKTLK